MNDTDIQRLKAELLALQQDLEILQAASHDATLPVELDQTRVGRLSRMDAMQGQQMAKETSRRREQQLLAIGGALRRIEAGDFGYCSVCDEEIDIRRLDVNPTTTRCINCMKS